MQKTYLSQLPKDIQQIVLEIECQSNVEINVIVDNDRTGSLACKVNECEASIRVPANFFPESSVLHELLHIRRFLVEKVPQISLREDYFNSRLDRIFTGIDTNLEHLVIVPEELKCRPKRNTYWVDAIRSKWAQLNQERFNNDFDNFDAAYDWVFIRHVLDDQDLLKEALSIIESAGLAGSANKLYDGLLENLSSKEEMVRICIDEFDLHKQYMALDYFDSVNGQYTHKTIEANA